MFPRRLELPTTSFFLFGPRATGKTTWLPERLPEARWYNLLLESELVRLIRERPGHERLGDREGRRRRAPHRPGILGRARRHARGDVAPCVPAARAANDSGCAGELAYWRTASGSEVDFVWSRGGRHVAVEVKATDRWRPEDTRALKELARLQPDVRPFAVFLGDRALRDGGVAVLPLAEFLRRLGRGEILR